MMSRIVRVIPREDYTLEIELDNHHKIIYDMKPRLGAVRFYSLADAERFRSVRVENGNILVWDSLCQISLGEIISLVAR
jgi:hypothetical protein